LTVSPYRIELWCGHASLTDPGPLERCCEGYLREDERRQADRFRRSTTRNQHVVGRAMARALLAPDGASPHEIEFTFNPYGKPDVVAPTSAMRPFNIAHTEGLVVFTCCQRGRIGVDVERLCRNTDVALARRYFAAPEVDYVMSQPSDDDQRLAFLRVWTLKESFIKAIGKGLSIPLADFAFEEIDSTSPKVRILDPALDDGCEWNFACVTPAAGYIASVALCDGAQRQMLEVQIRDFHSLLPPQPDEA